MAESKKTDKRFMQFQHTLRHLERQTEELERLAIAADRRAQAPDAPGKAPAGRRIASKKR